MKLGPTPAESFMVSVWHSPFSSQRFCQAPRTRPARKSHFSSPSSLFSVPVVLALLSVTIDSTTSAYRQSGFKIVLQFLTLRETRSFLLQRWNLSSALFVLYLVRRQLCHLFSVSKIGCAYPTRLCSGIFTQSFVSNWSPKVFVSFLSSILSVVSVLIKFGFKYLFNAICRQQYEYCVLPTLPICLYVEIE